MADTQFRHNLYRKEHRTGVVAANCGFWAAARLAARHDVAEDGGVTEHPACVDATITFSNGGEISVEQFRLDLPSADVDHQEIGRLLVASLGLLMADDVTFSSVEILEEQHKGTRGGPS